MIPEWLQSRKLVAFFATSILLVLGALVAPGSFSALSLALVSAFTAFCAGNVASTHVTANAPAPTKDEVK